MKAPKSVLAIIGRLNHEPVGAALLSLARDSSVYLAGGLLIGLGNIVLIPLYTHYLTPDQFGVYALLDVGILLAVTVTQFKFDVAYLKWFVDVGETGQGELLGSVLIVGAIASTAGGILMTLLVVSQRGELWLRMSDRSFAWLVLPIIVLENLQGLLLANLRARRQAHAYAAAAISRVLVMVGASYSLLALRHAGIAGVFEGRLIGDAACGLLLLAGCIRSVQWKFAWTKLKPMFRFGLPVVWCGFMTMMQDASGRYFLSRSGGLEQVGLLGAAIKISAISQVLIGAPFTVAWGGVLFQIAKLPHARMVYSKIFGYLFVVLMAFGLLLSVWGPTLFRIFTSPAYYSSIAVLPVVLLVRVANFQEQPASTGIFLAGRTDLFAYIYTAALVVNLIALYILVPRYGMAGAGWAWLSGSALIPAAMVFLGNRFYPLHYSWKLTILPALPWAVALYWRWHVPATFGPNQLLLQALLGASIVLGAVWLILGDFRDFRRNLRAAAVTSPVETEMVLR